MPYKDPEKRLAYARERYGKNREVIRRRSFKWYHDHKNRAKNRQLKKNFGITYDQFVEMLAAQNGVCAICCKPETRLSARGKIRHLAVDHCHTTGKIRKLLCGGCNAALGMLQEDPARIVAMLRYIQEHADA